MNIKEEDLTDFLRRAKLDHARNLAIKLPTLENEQEVERWLIGLDPIVYDFFDRRLNLASELEMTWTKRGTGRGRRYTLNSNQTVYLKDEEIWKMTVRGETQRFPPDLSFPRIQVGLIRALTDNGKSTLPVRGPWVAKTEEFIYLTQTSEKKGIFDFDITEQLKTQEGRLVYQAVIKGGLTPKLLEGELS